MEAVIFVPMLIAIAGLFLWGPQRTFVDVCLPCLLLLPTYFFWRTHGGMDFSMSVMLPLGIVMVGLAFSRWKLTRTDLWMGLFLFTTAYADVRIGQANLARYVFADSILTAFLPYMAGKLLIENGARLGIVKRVVMLLCLSCVAAIPECFLKMNLYEHGWMHFFPGQWPGWYTQVRWGFGRVAGQCGSPELYGLVLIAGMLLLLWVRKWNTTKKAFSLRDWSSSKQTTLLMSIIFGVTFFLTVSRGPWLGMLLGLLVASIGLAMHVRRTALIVAIACLVIAFPAYEVIKQYSGGPHQSYGSDQETAQYRRQMLDNYLPLAEAGGLWGWGTFHPVLAGQVSIDNEFLLVFLVQGYVGLMAYLLLILEAAYSLLRMGLVTKSRQDRHFCFTMLGLLTGWVLTLSTVYMGAQSFQMFFLIIGWTQALSRDAAPAAQEEAVMGTKTLTRVYT